MFERDYLVRMFARFAEAIGRSIARNKERDPEGAAATIEEAIGEATELDGDVLLSLAPESIASVLQVSGTDPRVIEYVSRSLLLEASFLEEAGNTEKARLRADQAYALADAYGIELSDASITEEELAELAERSANALE